MSWRTISDSVSDGVLTMSRKSFGTHWRLAPPMITIRGVIRPPRVLPAPEPRAGTASRNLTPASGCYPRLHLMVPSEGRLAAARHHVMESFEGLYAPRRHQLM